LRTTAAKDIVRSLIHFTPFGLATSNLSKAHVTRDSIGAAT